MNCIRVKRAIISVADKTGIVELASALRKFDIEIISTGGTLKVLQDSGIAVRAVSDVTGFPEILGGRVKTLHPNIHASLLAVQDNETHVQELHAHGIDSIDLVVVNLYPFEKTIASGEVSLDDAIEQIDIGGTTMLRAAAKNFKYKAAVFSPAQYGLILSELEQNNGSICGNTRFKLACEVFEYTSRYDTAIANYYKSKIEPGNAQSLSQSLSQSPDVLSFSHKKELDLRYGENPHQTGALYGTWGETFEKLHGKELSFNNIWDIQSAAELIEEFSEPAVAIIKHANPCGLGTGATLAECYEKALATDRISAFGGIVCMNRQLDMDTAKLLDTLFTEVAIAPGIDEDVFEFLKRKKDRRLIIQHKPVHAEQNLNVRSVAGGILAQTRDSFVPDISTMNVVTKRAPDVHEMKALLFAWKIAKHVKSNAVVYARPDRTLGIGAGQMSRVDSSRLAAMKAQNAGLSLEHCSVASDAFFPFADGLLEAIKAGATSVVQPGGSIRDEEVICAADENNIAMVFTGVRHFKH